MLFELAEIAAWQVSALSNEICESMIRGSNSRRVRKCPSSRRDRMPGRRERPGNPGHAARVRVLAGDAGSVAPFFPSRLQCDLAETEAGTVATLRETIEPEAGGLPEPRREPAVRPPYPPPSEPDLPGCRPVPLARRDLDIRDGRFEYWDDELTGWTYASLKGGGTEVGQAGRDRPGRPSIGWEMAGCEAVEPEADNGREGPPSGGRTPAPSAPTPAPRLPGVLGASRSGTVVTESGSGTP